MRIRSTKDNTDLVDTLRMMVRKIPDARAIVKPYMKFAAVAKIKDIVIEPRELITDEKFDSMLQKAQHPKKDNHRKKETPDSANSAKDKNKGKGKHGGKKDANGLSG